MTLEWPEQEGGLVEGKERVELDKVDDQLEVQSRKMRESTEADRANSRQ